MDAARPAEHFGMFGFNFSFPASFFDKVSFVKYIDFWQYIEMNYDASFLMLFNLSDFLAMASFYGVI